MALRLASWIAIAGLGAMLSGCAATRSAQQTVSGWLGMGDSASAERPQARDRRADPAPPVRPALAQQTGQAEPGRQRAQPLDRTIEKLPDAGHPRAPVSSRPPRSPGCTSGAAPPGPS